MNDAFIASSFINFSAADNPFLGFARSIGIPFSAAAAATDTASASPVVPFTTAISDTSFIPSNLLAIARAVSSLVSPFILSTFTFRALRSFSTLAEITASPPIIITSFAPNLFISLAVALFSPSLPVKSIGAFLACARGVAVKASGIAELFTSITVSALDHPSLLIFTAVSCLSFPIIVSLLVVAAITGATLPATIVIAITVAKCFGVFIISSSKIYFS